MKQRIWGRVNCAYCALLVLLGCSAEKRFSALSESESKMSIEEGNLSSQSSERGSANSPLQEDPEKLNQAEGNVSQPVNIAGANLIGVQCVTSQKTRAHADSAQSAAPTSVQPEYATACIVFNGKGKIIELPGKHQAFVAKLQTATSAQTMPVFRLEQTSPSDKRPYYFFESKDLVEALGVGIRLEDDTNCLTQLFLAKFFEFESND